jgi:beta-mannosidase
MQPFHGRVRLQLMDFSGKVLSQKDVVVEIQPLSAMQVWTTPQTDYLQGAEPTGVFLHTELRIAGENNGQPISTNNLYFLPYKDLHLPPAVIQAKWVTVEGKPALQLSSATLARDVDIQTGSLDADPSDNFFDLLPNQPKTIEFRGAAAPDQLRQSVRIMSLTDAFSVASSAEKQASQGGASQ